MRKFAAAVMAVVVSVFQVHAQLRVDFNDNDNGPRLTQAGFVEVVGSSGTVPCDYGVGDTLTIALTADGLDDRDRGALTGGPGQAQSDLLRDFIFRNEGTGVHIELSTLEPGAYTFTGFFHDNDVQQGDGTLSVDTGDGRGEVLRVPGFTYSTGTAPDPVGTASVSFVAVGHMVQVTLRDTSETHDAPYCINGFILEKRTFQKGPGALLAYYDFDDNCFDSSSNDNHGNSSTGGVMFVADTPAALSHSTKSASFDGSAYVDLDYLGLFDQAQSGGLTISFWAKKSGSGNVGWVIAEGNDSDTDPAYVFGNNSGPVKVQDYVRNDDQSVADTAVTTSDAFVAGEWHHIAVTDIGGDMNVYIDGVLDANSSAFDYTPSGTFTFENTAIGAWIKGGTADYYYPGLLDDVAIWSTVLSAADIADLAAGTTPLDIGSAQAVAHWRFEGASSAQPGSRNDWLDDYSGNGHVLTAAGNAAQVVLPGSGAGAAFFDPLPHTGEANAAAGTFDGNDFLSAADHDAFSSGTFTIEAYINADVIPGNNSPIIACHTDLSGGLGKSWFLAIDATSKKLKLSIHNGTTEEVFEGETISEDKDYYVAAAVDVADTSANGITLYVKNLTDGGGLLSNTFSHSVVTSLNNSGAPVLIGAGRSDGKWGFNGLIDEVRFSNTVLSRGQLLAGPVGTLVIFR